MWIIRWVVLLLIIVVVLGFSLQNQGEVVNIHLLRWESGPIPLYLALFVAFGFGMVSFLLIAVFQQLQTLTDLSKERRLRKKLESGKVDMEKELEDSKAAVESAEQSMSGLRREVEILRTRLEEAKSEADTGESKPEEKKDDEEDE